MTHPRRPAGKATYTPHVCHHCASAGCARCGNEGFVVGPKSRPASPDELTVSMLNLRQARRRAAA